MLPERTLQKVWLRRECEQQGRTEEGQLVRVLHPGRWNLLSGPDFLDGRWMLEGELRTGAIEIHCRARDWFAHGHHEDPAYDAVGLHVVLFPPTETEPRPRTYSGFHPPQLALLPLLRCGLEELAEEDALAELTGRDFLGLASDWLGRAPDEVRALCAATAAERWKTKCRHARTRIRRLGWSEACHGAALEVLGLRTNRAAMASVAARWTLAEMARQPPAIAEMLGYPGASWQWRGIRPANRPDARLAQYLAWLQTAPDWPLRMREWGERLIRECDARQGQPATTEEWRNRMLSLALEQFAGSVAWGCIGGKRLHNLVVDLAMPFAASGADEEVTASPLTGAWCAWWPADAPAEILVVLRAGGLLDRRSPVSNGLVQGALGAALRHSRAHAAASAATHQPAVST